MKSHDPAAVVVPEWRRRFEALVLAARGRPFAWGSSDCCMFAADAVLACSGVDPAAAVRGTYSTQDGADVVLSQMGGLEAVGALAGPSVPPLCAQTGDVGLVSDGEKELLAICLGPYWATPGPTGLGALPLRSARLAWRVAKNG